MAQRNNSTFSRVLDKVVRSDNSERRFGRAGMPHGYPFATLAPPVQSDASRECGPSERWDQALDWIAEPQDAASAPDMAGAPSDNATLIAAELGLTGALTHDELNRARRQFMWNNHPDRRPDVPRELANRRVAIAICSSTARSARSRPTASRRDDRSRERAGGDRKVNRQRRRSSVARTVHSHCRGLSSPACRSSTALRPTRRPAPNARRV